MSDRFLLDLNVLIALADADHIHHSTVHKWFDSSGHRDWGVCPLTEAGFVRVTSNPSRYGRTRSVTQSSKILAQLTSHPGCRFWPMRDHWANLTRPFATRIFGHQQITDAYLLGLAIEGNGVLVTFDSGIRHLAGNECKTNVLILSP